MLCDDFQHLLTNPWLFTCWRATGSSNIVDGFRLYLVSLSTNTHSVGSLITLKHYRKNRHLPDYLLSLCALSRACLLPGTGSEEPPLYAQWSLSRHCSTLCIMIQSLQHQMALSLLVRPRLCRCTVLGALLQSSGQSVGLIPASVLPRAHLFQTFKPLLGLGATAAHDLVNVVHLWNLDSLLSRPQARLDCCCRQRRSDRLFLRGSDVSEVRLVLASHVLHDGMRDLVLHCLAAKLLIWTSFAAEASGCFCRELIVALDLPCSHPLWVRSFHSGARQSCWDFSLFSTVCRAVRDVLAGELFACCAWFSGLTSTTVHVILLLKAASSLSGLLSDLRAQLLWFAKSFLALANGLSMTSIVLRVLCFGVRDVSHRSFLLRHRRVGHVIHGTDTLVLVDRSACLMEFCTCDRHSKCSRTSRSAHSCPREPHRFRPVSQSLHLFVSGLRDLGLLLDDRLGSAPPPLCS